MTFVKARLLIEKMAPGKIAEIRLTGGEPLENVPASLTELGLQVLSVLPESGEPGEAARTGPDARSPGIHRITVRKS